MAAGIVSADALSVRDVEDKVVEVKKSDIAKRDSAPSSMPEIYTTILTKSELRDVVEYVATLGAPAAGRGPGGFRGGPGFGPGGNAGALPPPRALKALAPEGIAIPRQP